MPSRKKTVVAVIPAYNEELTITGIIDKAERYVDRIIVIDDASTDDTYKLAKRENVVMIHHPINMGLGVSLRDGFKKALEMKSDIILTIDSDGQHDPADIPKFIEKINEGYDFVLGRRELYKYPLLKKVGNFFLNFATNFVAGTTLDDTEGGFRAFSRLGLEKLVLKADRYQIATEIIFEVGRNRLKACNVPASSPLYVKGVGVMDGVRNFTFLMHRRERHWWDYLNDVRYVLRKYI
ncbi:MAG: glycosyltransferase family 2 protein [Candidatus Aenigmatarchaeota archaeon]